VRPELIKINRPQARSDASGKFRIRLPNGQYKLSAKFDDASVRLVQQELEAAVAHRNVALEPFVVESFAVSGKVHTHAEKGSI
jgi:hypothetical protein